MKQILIDAKHKTEEIRIALVEDHVLYDLVIERPDQELKTGNIYLGKVTSIEPSLDAAFIDYGSSRHGFLPIREVSRDYFPESLTSERSPNIKDVLKEGQELLVQVTKEERGTKGAALTTFPSLPGSYLVLMPNNPRASGISKRIEGDERTELKEYLAKLEVPEGAGLIVRTAGVNKTLEELEWDLNVLITHWNAIQAAAKESKAPRMIHRETRTIRDYLRQDICAIIVNEKGTHDTIKEYLQQVSPHFVKCLKLYEDTTPLFNYYKIEQQLEGAYQRQVELPSGGSIVIDQTEALVAIDINSARATRGADIEETALQTNLEAADEIARQLRLRDIGGLIVIDFIDMTPTSHQRKVEQRLREALRLDRARVQVNRISRFGLLEMSRQRLRTSLREGVQSVCPRCDGQGMIRGVESLSLSILRVLEEDSNKANLKEIQLQVPLDVSAYLLNEKRDHLLKIESNHNVHIMIIPNPNLQTPQYTLKRIQMGSGKHDNKSNEASYQLIESPEVKTPPNRKGEKRKQLDEPAVKHIPSLSPAPKSGITGLFKRLINRISSESNAAANKPPKSVNKPSRPPSSRTRGTHKHHRQRSPRQRARSGGNRKPKAHSETPKRADRPQQRTPSTHPRHTRAKPPTQDESK